MKQVLIFTSFLFSLALVNCCSDSKHLTKSSNPSKYKEGLKDHFKDYFTIGVAVSPQSLKTDEAGLILQEFNSMTPENAMKMGPIHPFEKVYNWTGGDSIAAFAKRNNLKLADIRYAGIIKLHAGFLQILQPVNK